MGGGQRRMGGRRREDERVYTSVTIVDQSFLVDSKRFILYGQPLSFCSRMKSRGVSAVREFALSGLVHFTKSLNTPQPPPYFEIAKEEGSNLGFAALPGIIVALTLR